MPENSPMRTTILLLISEPLVRLVIQEVLERAGYLILVTGDRGPEVAGRQYQVSGSFQNFLDHQPHQRLGNKQQNRGPHRGVFRHESSSLRLNKSLGVNKI